MNCDRNLPDDNSVAALPPGAETGQVTSAAKPVYPVSVRELVDFALRRGNLGGKGDFVGPARALAGTRGHARIARSRPSHYQKEVALTREIETEELILRIQGRLDGLLVEEGKVLLEEIKTVQAGWDGQPDPLHWAQVKVYGAIYGSDCHLPTITLQLTYLNLDTGTTTLLEESFELADLTAFLEEAAALYLGWIRDWHRWCRERDGSIASLAFPFPAYRSGQRELAVAAYRVLSRGGRLFLEAPTGIGKTMAVLFPAAKALGEGRLKRLFYLTARTLGKTVCESALNEMRRAGLRFRSVTLTAKDKVCVREGHPCDPGTCPLAIGYYDRRHQAMRAALNRQGMTRAVLETVSQEHQVCPFELSLDLSLWVDAIICDYNYVFDPRVYLRRHFDEDGGDHAFLVDEAHQLVDRAREMFSAELRNRDLLEVGRAIRKSVPRCARALGQLRTALRRLAHPADAIVPADEGSPSEPDLFRSEALPGNHLPQANHGHGPAKVAPGRDGILIHRALPMETLPLLEKALKEAETWLARNQPAEFREDLLELYFSLLAFSRTAAAYDERYVTMVEPGSSVRVRLYCLDPSQLLRQALARGKAAVLFSATLTPLDYYRTLLGGQADDPTLQLESPFPPQNLAVLVHDRIRTEYRARADSRMEVAQAIQALVRGRPGNYLVYFPSYQYLAAVQETFEALKPGVALQIQRPNMSEADRETFLRTFTIGHGETLVGFAVMGGVFGEGIDLVGEHLIGAVIVGVGLPQLCAERDLIRAFFQASQGSGFEYAYTYPGMNRVLQAVGRVIRTEHDHGVVLLLDTRFGEARYRGLFPRWWRWARVRNVQEIAARVAQFWEGREESAIGGQRADDLAGDRGGGGGGLDIQPADR